MSTKNISVEKAVYSPIDRTAEIEIINSIVHFSDFQFRKHFSSDSTVFIDNIYGGFDTCITTM